MTERTLVIAILVALILLWFAETLNMIIRLTQRILQYLTGNKNAPAQKA